MTTRSLPRRRLIRPRWARAQHPVYRLEAESRRGNRGLVALRLGCAPVIFAVTTLALLPGLVTLLVSVVDGDEYGVSSSLALTLIPLIMIQLVAGAIVNVLTVAQTAPMISGEIELQSWRLLRTTTMPLREIIFAKFAAAATHLRAPLVGLMILRAISLGTAYLLFAYLIRDIFYYMSAQEWVDFWARAAWLPPLLSAGMVTLFYISQPVLQFVLNGSIGLLASSLSQTRARAVVLGLVGRLIGWVASAMFNFTAIYGLGFLILGNWASPHYAPLEAFHNRPVPTELQQSWAINLTIVGYFLAMLASQIGLVLFALGITQRRARQLGV